MYESMLLNPHFPRPPVSLDDFKAVLDRFSEVMGESVHGDRRMFAEKANLREEIIGMMRQLGHYVEAACENDMATFVASGFEAGPTAHVPPVPLPQPSIQKIEQGLSGQLLVRISSLGRKAKSYNLRYAALDGDGTPRVWTLITLTSAKAAVSGLTPGRTYAFQVRAFGNLGHTDWSDSATRMCI